MSHLRKRVLPFTLTLATGLVLAAMLGTWHSREWRHRYRTSGAFIQMDGHDPYRRGWARRGCEFKRSVEVAPAWSTPRVDADSSPVAPSTPVHVISYSNAGAIDGLPVSRDAVITNLPTPRFWAIATEREFHPAFDLMLRVTLVSSGKVGEIEKLSGSTDNVSSDRTVGNNAYQPPHLEDDIMAAARAIQFRPAMRGGVPVSQQVTILYRQQ